MFRLRSCGVIQGVCSAVIAVLVTGCSSSDKGSSSPDNGLDASTSACSPPDGGLPCDPYEVVCGSVTCSTPREFCCISADAPPSCLPTGASCTAPIVALYCDEAADCAAGQVCCSATQNGVPTLYCATSCARTSSVQVCRTSAECSNGQPCITQACQGAIVEACGPVAGCEPG